MRKLSRGKAVQKTASDLSNPAGADQVLLAPGEQSYLRIGAIARLTGIPQATLRAWESRYGAFRPLKSEGGQRLFSPQDATRASLIRILSRRGHSLGAIASASLDALLALKAQHDREGLNAVAPARSRRSMIVCGEALAVRLIETLQQSALMQAGLELTRVISGFDEGQVLSVGQACDLVAVELVSLHRVQSAAITRLVAALPRARFLVLYRFGPQATMRELQALGVSVCREPVDDSSLSLAIRALLPQAESQGAHSSEAESSGFSAAASLAIQGPVPEPRFSPAILLAVQTMPAKLPCECPRHVAELLAQLMAFEGYSKECLNTALRSAPDGVQGKPADSIPADDSFLHQRLWTLAAGCRAAVEEALVWVSEHEGIDIKALEREQQQALEQLRLRNAGPQTA